MCMLEADYTIEILLITKEQKQSTIYYKVTLTHRRDGNPKKCIWTIYSEEEVDCFRQSANHDWLEDTKGWGLKINEQGKLENIGLSPQNEILKIAKFVDSSKNGECHGYPADYRRGTQDRQSTDILIKWNTKHLITNVAMNKFRLGKLCYL